MELESSGNPSPDDLLQLQREQQLVGVKIFFWRFVLCRKKLTPCYKKSNASTSKVLMLAGVETHQRQETAALSWITYHHNVFIIMVESLAFDLDAALADIQR